MSQQHPADPQANGYFPPATPAAVYHGHFPPAYTQQNPIATPLPHLDVPPAARYPAMHYAPPPAAPAAPAPSQVFLGFLHRGHTSVPMYGPPGAKFDWIGNVFVELPDGTKDWFGPYRNGFGYEMKNPRQRAEEDCCWTNFRMFHDDLYWK